MHECMCGSQGCGKDVVPGPGVHEAAEAGACAPEPLRVRPDAGPACAGLTRVPYPSGGRWSPCFVGLVSKVAL